MVIFNAFIQEEHADNRRFLRTARSGLSIQSRFYGMRNTRVRARGLAQGALYEIRPLGTVLDAPETRGYRGGVPAKRPSRIRLHGGRGRLAACRVTHDRQWRFGPADLPWLSHADCLAIVERAAIQLPAIYGLGFNNANCIACCKGGEGYWNHTRDVFPADFAEVVQIQESIGPGAYSFLNRKTDERFGLNNLIPGTGGTMSSCRPALFVCADAEEEIECAL